MLFSWHFFRVAICSIYALVQKCPWVQKDVMPKGGIFSCISLAGMQFGTNYHITILVYVSIRKT